MKKVLLLILMFSLITYLAFGEKRERDVYDAAPVVIYGKDSTGALYPLRVDASGQVAMSLTDALLMPQIATPANPAAGYDKLYFKNDDKLYKLTSAGAETEIGAGGGGATAWDDIGDPDADTTIAFGGFESTITSTLDAAGKTVFTISNTDADVDNDTYLITLKYVDDGDANAHFFRCIDDSAGAPNTVFSIGADGNLYIDGLISAGDSITAGGLSVPSGTAILGTNVQPVDFYIHDGGGIWMYEDADDFLCSAVCKDGAAEWQFNDDVNIGANGAAEDIILWGNLKTSTPTTLSAAELDRLDGLTSAIIDDDKIDTFAELDAIVTDKALVNKADGAVWLGTHDFSGATDMVFLVGTIEAGAYGVATIDGDDVNSNIAGRSLTLTGAAPDTLDADAELYTTTKCILIETPADADDLLFFRPDNAVTITSIDGIVESATSAVVVVSECDSAGDNCGSANSKLEESLTCDVDGATDDGTIGNAGVAAGNWLRAQVGTVTGTPGHCTVCVTMTLDD
jgi:hypothetical protein